MEVYFFFPRPAFSDILHPLVVRSGRIDSLTIFLYPRPAFHNPSWDDIAESRYCHRLLNNRPLRRRCRAGYRGAEVLTMAVIILFFE
jgi:hypothetical protein